LFYFKDAQRTCNKYPVYKAKEQASYIFKTAKGFWCDQYIPSGLIDCKTNDCTEIRFEMPDWSQQEYAVPEELELQGQKFFWVPKTTHKITCSQNSASVIETNILMPTTRTTTNKPVSRAFKTHEQILDEKLAQLLTARNNYFNTGKGNNEY
jgi:hypothetical protein